MYVKVLTATVLATAASQAQGQAQGQQLDTALQNTLASDPQIAGADAAVQAATAAVDISRAGRLPTLGLDLRGELQATDNPFDTGRRQRFGVAAAFDLPLYAGGEIDGRIRASRAALAAGIADRDGVVNMRLATAASRYAGLYRDRMIVDARTAQVTGVETILDATRERARLKELTDADVQQGVARLALSKARLAQARAALIGSAEDLREVTGRYFGAVADAEPPPLPPALLQILPQEVASFPSVQLAEARIEMAKADIRIARSTRLPRLYLSSALQGANDLAANPSILVPRYQTAMQIGFRLSVPLYQGGGPGARVRQAQQVLANRIEDRRDAENRAIYDIRSQFAQLRAAEASLDVIATAIRANEAALDSVKVQALLGDRTNIDILNAQEELTQARVRLAETRQQRLALAYSILGVMGRLRSRAEAPAPAVRRDPPPPAAPKTAATFRFDKVGLWVWQGSTTWSLTPGRATGAAVRMT